MEYGWIAPESVPWLKENEPVLLFGAGQGTVELLAYLEEQQQHPDLIGIVDNDCSMWGKSLHGLPIVPPASIPESEWSKIIITTVSGRDQVAAQLQAMGYAEFTHYHRIGTYPAASVMNLLNLNDMQRAFNFMKEGDSVLHVGPGGFLSLEVALHCLGFRPLSMDAYSFSMHYPETTHRLQQYRSVLEYVLRMPQAAELGEETIRRRFDEVLHIRQDGRAFLDTERLPYMMPARYSAIPLPDNALDTICSFAVLEHVRDPLQAIRETWRVLKPGGFAAHRITTRDHRSFSAVSGYHPFSYLNESPASWESINENKFYQNRVLPEQWKELFTRNGFALLHYKELHTYDLSADEVAALHADFKNPDGTLPANFSNAVDCELLARKL
jgi:SAM-dependent methyltransferase